MQAFRKWGRSFGVAVLAGVGLGACSQTSQFTDNSQFCGFDTVKLATAPPGPGTPVLASNMPPAPAPPSAPPPAPAPVPVEGVRSPDAPAAAPVVRARPVQAVQEEPVSELARLIEGSLSTPAPQPAPAPPPPTVMPTPPVTGEPGDGAHAPAPVMAPPEPAPVPRVMRRAPDVLLALSGGSENGAFGAGILAGWDGPLPEFRTVTGVSTGAILASFAFAGSKESAKAGYTIEAEEQLLTPFVTPTDGRITSKNFPTLLRRGSFADLVPLRGRLKHFLSDPIMERIAMGHGQGRRLYVGATDVDTGEGVAFDLGNMAMRYVAATDPVQKARWKDCYVEAIVASSSTPMAAPPVFIDNAMYIDGGSRFGMFSSAMMEVRRKRATTPGGQDYRSYSAPPPTIYAIVNGTLNMAPAKCPKEDPKLCEAFPPHGGPGGKHKNWNILELALGSEKILVNQVYRFSAQEVGQSTCDEAGCLHFMRIDRDVAEFTHTLPNPEKDGAPEALTCSQWRDVDNRVDNPVQFHKRFMRCLIAYGEYRAQNAGWGGS
ncbi:patatin-like phospholipase family protein [Qipengyuania sp. DSG2-2]|uniref:patatin-like phospholipase family protein n=1 Tax=Qipengyuania sp. DGS2-2 TaxID=3349631 RepID=UPI0036D2FAD2